MRLPQQAQRNNPPDAPKCPARGARREWRLVPCVPYRVKPRGGKAAPCCPYCAKPNVYGPKILSGGEFVHIDLVNGYAWPCREPGA